ncbi:hypothetical protein [Brucella rhizosphaerae]|uniref:hypothetical protein n=1 Tax=Brucella rhizosphaerae TaxID=571254 RepID=UPI0035BBD6A1
MIADLPCAGRRIELHLTVRRFVCNVVHCRRKIFAERFGDGVIRPMARRTARLETLVYHLGCCHVNWATVACLTVWA